MRRVAQAVLAVALAILVSGCLGTLVQSPPRGRPPISTTHVHLLAAPFRIDAHVCERGLARVDTFIPLWGVAVGILTFGILVPKTTAYYCVERS